MQQQGNIWGETKITREEGQQELKRWRKHVSNKIIINDRRVYDGKKITKNGNTFEEKNNGSEKTGDRKDDKERNIDKKITLSNLPIVITAS